MENIYCFWCARYKDISFKEFLNIGITEFRRKIISIPETEPLHKIIQSRTIKTSKIKDKEERKYWNELKRINKIPDIYLSNRELDDIAKNMIKNGGLINGKRFN